MTVPRMSLMTSKFSAAVALLSSSKSAENASGTLFVGKTQALSPMSSAAAPAAITMFELLGKKR